MNLSSLLRNHSHYWGIPHKRESDGKLVMICYECGKIRLVTADIAARQEVV